MFGSTRTFSAQFARVAGAVLLAVALAACGTGASPSASSAAPGGSGGSQIVGPVILDQSQLTATVKLGRMVVFSLENPETWTMKADPDGLVKLDPGTNDGSMVTNPGAETLAAGTVTITLTNPAGTSLIYTITIEQ